MHSVQTVLHALRGLALVTAVGGAVAWSMGFSLAAVGFLGQAAIGVVVLAGRRFRAVSRPLSIIGNFALATTVVAVLGVVIGLTQGEELQDAMNGAVVFPWTLVVVAGALGGPPLKARRSPS